MDEILDIKLTDSEESIKKNLDKLNPHIKYNKQLIAINFDKPIAFNPTDFDYFEVQDASNRGEVISHNIILGEPKTGRIFYLNRELKLIKMDIIPKWHSRERLKNFKNVLKDIQDEKIIKLKKEDNISK